MRKINLNYLGMLGIVFGFFLSPKNIQASSFPQNPCTDGFEITVHLSSAENFDATSEDSHFTVSSRKLNPKQCQKWQAETFPHFKRMLFDNQHLDRAEVICNHIAKVEYRFGSDLNNKKQQKICIGDSSKDGVSHGFRLFYEGSK